MQRKEFARIARFEAYMAQTIPPDGPVWLPSGDDAACMRPTSDISVCTDTLVEGQHFLRTVSTPYDVGVKAINVNISDLAAMGATPAMAVIALAINHATWSEEDLDALYQGLRDAAITHGVTLAGGDTVRSDTFAITVTAIGLADGPIVTRTKAQVGDVILAVGHLGASGAALHAIEHGTDPASIPADLLQAHTQGVAYPVIGQWLAQAGATAMIDISDGIGADLAHIGVGSGVSLGLSYPLLAPLVPPGLWDIVQPDPLPTPLDEARADVAITDGLIYVQPDDWVRLVSSGEDFALVATLGVDAATACLERITQAYPTLPAAIIGVVGPGDPVSAVTLFDYWSDHPEMVMGLDDLGWDHGD